ncbi:MAG: CvpA family protein [Verrucomicrobiota bacterium]
MAEYFKNLNFNYIDLIILVVLVIGIFRGRKRGISEELLTFLQWLVILFGGAAVYQPLGKQIAGVAPLSNLTCYIIAYLIFACLVKLLFLRIQRAVGEKLVSSNVFGSFEYYLGMLAGLIRFGCAMLVFMALLNAKLITEQERLETAKMQSKNFEGISFPTFGSFQQSVLFQSFTGRQVTTYMKFVLIESTASSNVPVHRRENDGLNDIIGKTK